MYTNDNDGYPEFEQNLKLYFNKAISSGKKLFNTNVEDLYEVYLNSFSEEARQHYTCNACRHFINRYGGLVSISEDGYMESVMWDESNTPEFFLEAVRAMKQAVLKSRVNGVFIPEMKILGTPTTGKWTHLSVTLPSSMVNSSRLLTSHQVMAQKLEDFKMLTNALLSYSIYTVNQALTLLQSESLYRSQKVLGVAEWFKAVHEKRDSVGNSTLKTNIVWLAVATAPTGFTHIKSSMIGTLLDDISEGMSEQAISNRFKEKMNPATHMRSQTPPSESSIYQAEKVIEKLGLANSLQRRYATLEEVQSICKSRFEAKDVVQKAGSVFGHLTPKSKDTSVMNLPSTIMTWDKFLRTVLPTAENIEALVDNPGRLMALVTASDTTSENILQWDNPFSWYYHGGIDGEIKRRVESAGGRYGNNEIRVSLIWESYSDLDIHCITPRGTHIYYGNKRDINDGYLDIDMNAGGSTTNTPVENIRWANNAPEGRYRFYVNNYSDRNSNHNPYSVELEVNGKVFKFQGVATGTGYRQDVFEFDYVRGQQPNLTSHSVTSDDSWTISPNSFVKVNAVTPSPNLWGDNTKPQSGSHVFFLLDGCKDLSEGKGRGFFNETLKSELREIRKTLEAFTANTPIQDADKATACGVGYSIDSEWNLTLKVTSNNSNRIIKIDRWD